MHRCGDVQLADVGEPQGREAGFTRPVVVVTAQLVLDQHPNVVHVVPLTSTIRGYRSEVRIEPDPDNGLKVASAAPCQHIRTIAVRRDSPTRSATSDRRHSARCARSSPTSSTCSDPRAPEP